jgi:hypothetical protein
MHVFFLSTGILEMLVSKPDKRNLDAFLDAYVQVQGNNCSRQSVEKEAWEKSFNLKRTQLEKQSVWTFFFFFFKEKLYIYFL